MTTERASMPSTKSFQPDRVALGGCIIQWDYGFIRIYGCPIDFSNYGTVAFNTRDIRTNLSTGQLVIQPAKQAVVFLFWRMP